MAVCFQKARLDEKNHQIGSNIVNFNNGQTKSLGNYSFLESLEIML